MTGEAADAFAQATSLAGLDPTALHSAVRKDGPARVDGRPPTRHIVTTDHGRAGGLLANVLAGLDGAGSAVRDAAALGGAVSRYGTSSGLNRAVKGRKKVRKGVSKARKGVCGNLFPV